MRFLSTGVIALTAVTLFGTALGVGAGAAVAQDSGPTQPLTGRARPCVQGKIETMECENIELLSFIPRDNLAESVGADLWAWHDTTTGREFIVSGGNSTSFIEVTDPLNPKYLGFILPPNGIDPAGHAAQSVRVYKNYAYIGYEGVEAGLQIVDLTQLRDVKTPTEFKETAHYDGITNTHTITINQETGLASVNGSNTCGGGLHLIDLKASPTKPTYIGCYEETAIGRGYVHDAQCVTYRGPDKRYQGHELCVNYAEQGITIADVTDRKAIKTVSTASYPSVAYTHQGWFTEDQRYFFLNDEGDENGAVANTRTIGFDLSDVQDPIVLVEYLNPKTTSTDHNLFIRGKYMYQGNYGAGMRVIDVSTPKTPKEVAYLTEIGGAWGTYPFLKNDVVAIPASSGLYLVRLKLP